MAVVLVAPVCRKGVVTSLPDHRGDRLDQPAAEPTSAVGRVRTHRADLRPAGRPEPLAGHRHQRPVVPDAQVRAEFHGPRPEWSWVRTSHQVEHLRHVLQPEPDRLSVRFGGDGRVHQLHSGDLEDLLPRHRGGLKDAGQHGYLAGADQRGQVLPAGLVAVVFQRHERRDLGQITRGPPIHLRHAAMRARQSTPAGVVQRMCPDLIDHPRSSNRPPQTSPQSSGTSSHRLLIPDVGLPTSRSRFPRGRRLGRLRTTTHFLPKGAPHAQGLCERDRAG